MRSRFIILAGLLLALAVSVAFIDGDEPLKAILTKLEKFRAEYPQEKVHLHLDKPYYAIGDTIWFKAYVVNAELHKCSNLSQILNVELIDEQDSIRQSIRLPLTTGIAWGDFQLPDSLAEGNYRIRAYTNYMRNFDHDFFYDKTILVGNAIANKVITNVSYQYETQGAEQKVNATINYADKDSIALAGKEVSYNVQLENGSITKGKAITDAKGDIHISFVNHQPSVLRSGRVNTILTMDKQISIHKNFPVKATSNETDVQFFAEGGNPVVGIRSRMAFKAIGTDGLGKNITGYVSNSSGEKVAEIKTSHAGMGFFYLYPMAGQTYTALVKFPDGSEKKINLPEVQPEGLVLAADNTDSTSLGVKISASPATIAAGGQFTLIAQSNSVVKFVSKNNLDRAVFNANLPKSRFPTGILQLTLFDQKNQPVAERLVFINHHDFLNVAINGPQACGPRKKVKMELDVKDPSGQPVSGTFSVAVTDATKVPVDVNDESTILTDLLLTSDIKGYVEQPNYYFTAVDDQKVHDLDNLMMTQGWRRFTWKNILADQFPPLIYKAEDGITISGRITQNKKPVVGGKVMLLSSQGGFFVMDTLTDADGRFAFKGLIFRDSTHFIVQARTAKDKKFVDIELDRVPPQMVTKNKNAAEVEVNVNRKMVAYLKNSRNYYEELLHHGLIHHNTMLAEVKIVDHKYKEKTVKGSANLLGHANYVVPSEDLQTCTNILECLQGRVPGYMLRGNVPFLMRSANQSLSGPTPMTILLDGVRVDTDMIADVNPADVEGVEILEGAMASVYGSDAAGGIIIVTTKGPGSGNYYNSYVPGILSFMPRGYYKSKEFYKPNYDGPKPNKPMPDLRTTVFWQPNLIIKGGKAALEYFNSDGQGPYKVTIEGINANGNLARYVYNYTVN